MNSCLVYQCHFFEGLGDCHVQEYLPIWWFVFSSRRRYSNGDKHHCPLCYPLLWLSWKDYHDSLIQCLFSILQMFCWRYLWHLDWYISQVGALQTHSPFKNLCWEATNLALKLVFLTWIWKLRTGTLLSPRCSMRNQQSCFSASLQLRPIPLECLKVLFLEISIIIGIKIPILMITDV